MATDRGSRSQESLPTIHRQSSLFLCCHVQVLSLHHRESSVNLADLYSVALAHTIAVNTLFGVFGLVYRSFSGSFQRSVAPVHSRRSRSADSDFNTAVYVGPWLYRSLGKQKKYETTENEHSSGEEEHCLPFFLRTLHIEKTCLKDSPTKFSYAEDY